MRIVTAEDILELIARHPAGLNREELRLYLGVKYLPLYDADVGSLCARGYLVAQGYFEDGGKGLWIYRYRLSVNEFLRRARRAIDGTTQDNRRGDPDPSGRAPGRTQS